MASSSIGLRKVIAASSLLKKLVNPISSASATVLRSFSTIHDKFDTRNWESREDADALYMKMDMLGLNKKTVKVSVEQNAVMVKAEREMEDKLGEHRRRLYNLPTFYLVSNVYNIDEINAVIKNEELKIRVPKLKEDYSQDTNHTIDIKLL